MRLLKSFPTCPRLLGVTRARCSQSIQQQCPTTNNKRYSSSRAGVVPIVDMFLPAEEIGRAVHEACTTVGFFHLVNHGVSETLRQNVLDESRNMFTSLSNEQKETFSVAHSNSYRGYQRMGVNVTSHKQDGHEGFDLISESPRAIRRATDYNHAALKGLTNHGYNQWPDPTWVPNLRPTLEQYIQEMNHVGMLLMSASSTGLGLGPDYFKPFFTDPYWTMRLIRYPAPKAGEAISDPYDYGVGEHSDYGVFTMILADPVPNTLQIRPKNAHRTPHSDSPNKEEWWTVDPVEGGFICNIGDMLARWTNGIYVSTPHRVLRPRAGQPDRISVPFFFDPDYDARIGPIDQLVAASELPSPCFEPIMYGDHLLAKMSKNFVL